jgi:hypothetical protein
VIAYPLRESAVSTILKNAFGTSIQDADLLCIIEDENLPSFRAFFENLGGMQVKLASNYETALETMDAHSFDGFILSLALPGQTFDDILQTILRKSSGLAVPPVIGLLPEPNAPSAIENVTELAREHFEQTRLGKEEYFERLIQHLNSLDL